MNLPTDIANQALDASGVEFTLGDLEEGTRPAQVLLRAYGQCLRQLLRSAHWDFARRQAPLVLLADATGQTPNVGTQVVGNGISGIYEYSYPTDAAKARFIPWNQSNVNPGSPSGNIVPPNPAVPLTTGMGQPPLAMGRIVPARFTISTDFNYPPPSGQITWEVQGVSPQGRTVVLTNVQNAELVYTAIMLYPSVWDVQFRAALVSYLASEIAVPLAKDKKFGVMMQDRLIKATKDKITAARMTDGNEGWYSSDIAVDWMRARSSGTAWGGNGCGGTGAAGYCGYGYDSAMFADGSAY